MKFESIEAAVRFGDLARRFADARREFPGRAAAAVLDGVRKSEEWGVPLVEAMCPGHEWAYTGSAYGGDDDRWHGEGRCYCVWCGADGDA